MKHQVTSHGYRLVYVPNHPDAHATGIIYEHRLVMERVIGRRLLRSELVHHRNGNKLDNRPENLELAQSIAVHKAAHRSGKHKLREPGQPNSVIACSCGCGTPLMKYDAAGRERHYLPGHWRKGKSMYDRSEMVTCACGCGTVFLKFDESRRVRRFVSGHNVARKAIDRTAMIVCACGCGQMRPKYDCNGIERHCMPGHKFRHKSH